jgi:hypothetical protein
VATPTDGGGLGSLARFGTLFGADSLITQSEMRAERFSVQRTLIGWYVVPLMYAFFYKIQSTGSCASVLDVHQRETRAC